MLEIIMWVVLGIVSWPTIGALSGYALDKWETYTTEKERDVMKYTFWLGWITLVILAIAFVVVLFCGLWKVIKIVWSEGISEALYYMAGYRKPVRVKKNATNRPKKSGNKNKKSRKK